MVQVAVTGGGGGRDDRGGVGEREEAMSLLAIPPKRVRLYRLLWDRWIIVLRILFDLGAGAHPVRWRSVADVLLVDKKTSQKYISGLVREGHITASGEGYMLTQSGFAFLLDNEQGGIPPSGEKIIGKNSQLESVVVVESELNLIPTTTTTTTESGKNPGENISPLAFHSPEVQTALDHADLLFEGASVAQVGLDHYLHIEKVLGWLAYAYDQRHRLYAPAGLVRSKLKDPSAPMPTLKYARDPLAFFPDEYLEAIGRWVGTCTLCGETFENQADYQEHVTTVRHPEQAEAEDEAAIVCADETVTEAMLANWRDALVNLRVEMPRASFETWVQDAAPVHYEGGVLQVAARNAYARDWLASHALARVQDLLGEQVLFVADRVAAETEPVHANP